MRKIPRSLQFSYINKKYEKTGKEFLREDQLYIYKDLKSKDLEKAVQLVRNKIKTLEFVDCHTSDPFKVSDLYGSFIDGMDEMIVEDMDYRDAIFLRKIFKIGSEHQRLNRTHLKKVVNLSDQAEIQGVIDDASIVLNEIIEKVYAYYHLRYKGVKSA